LYGSPRLLSIRLSQYPGCSVCFVIKYVAIGEGLFSLLCVSSIEIIRTRRIYTFLCANLFGILLWICSGFKIRLLIGISIRILWPSPVSRSPPRDGRGVDVGVSSVRRASELDGRFGRIEHGVRLAYAAARRAGFVDAHGGWRVGLVFCSDGRETERTIRDQTILWLVGDKRTIRDQTILWFVGD